MRKLVSGVLFACAAAAAAVVLSASAAFAAGPPFTISPVGNFESASTHIMFEDTNTGAQFTCANASVPGRVPSATSADGVGIALLAETGGRGDGMFTNCTGPLGSTGHAELQTGQLDAKNFDPATGTTTGQISGIHATLTINSFIGTCTAVVTGSVHSGAYNNNGTLTVSADPAPTDLVTQSTAGSCAGLVNAGDTNTFEGSFAVDPVITIGA